MSEQYTPIELPAGRASRAFQKKANIQDPNWIPILHGGVSVPQPEEVLTPYFDAVPRFPSRASSRPTTPRDANGTGSDLSRGVPLSELEAGPVPLSAALRSLGMPSGRSTPQLRHMSSSDDVQTLRSHGYTVSTGAPSTIGTQSLLEDQVYTIPGNSMPKDDVVFPPIQLSTRSSTSSVKKPAVPISKYSRKPVSRLQLDNANSDTISLPPSQPQTPHDSPRLQHTRSMEKVPSLAHHKSFESPRLRSAPSTEHVQMSLPQTPLDSPRLQSSSNLENTPLSSRQYPVAPPIPQELPTVSSRLIHAKSTASERKARALHSHPSNPSIRSDHSPTESTQLSSVQPVTRPRRLTDSRKSSIHELPPPTAAPREPLPDLPPEARRPPTRERQSHSKSQNQSRSENQLQQPSTQQTPITRHNELADFMIQKNLVIFRRFDDVHVRLLLSLQDEISNLEKELVELETPGRATRDRDGQKVKIMAELGRLLAEYDHLFANWKQMQASPADKQVRENLESWLQQSNGTGQGMSDGAKADLAWVKETKDLSCVAVGTKHKKEESGSAMDEKRSVKSARKRGGFAGLFSCCAGQRK